MVVHSLLLVAAPLRYNCPAKCDTECIACVQGARDKVRVLRPARSGCLSGGILASGLAHRRLVELLIVIVPLIGLIYGGFKAVSKVRNARRRPGGRGAAARTDATRRPSGRRSCGRCGSTTGPTPAGWTTNRRQQAARLSAHDRYARSVHAAVPPRQAAGGPAASRRRRRSARRQRRRAPVPRRSGGVRDGVRCRGGRSDPQAAKRLLAGRNSSVSHARTARCGSRRTPPRRRRNGNAPSTSPAGNSTA